MLSCLNEETSLWPCGQRRRQGVPAMKRHETELEEAGGRGRAEWSTGYRGLRQVASVMATKDSSLKQELDPVAVKDLGIPTPRPTRKLMPVSV